MATRRRPGGGRKPLPAGKGKPAQFQARISAGLRAALESEHLATGESISAIAARLLLVGWRHEHERERNAPTRALCYVIAELADTVCRDRRMDGKPNPDWRTDPATFKAFRLSIVKFMDKLQPPGKARAGRPSPFGTTPEERADFAVKVILSNIDRAEDLDIEKMFGPGLDKRAKVRLERTVYGLKQVREDLFE
jgi:hypothetical protein